MADRRRHRSGRRPAGHGSRRHLERLRHLNTSQRILALAMGMAVLIGTVAVAQVSLVGNRGPWGWWWGRPRPPVCVTSVPPPTTAPAPPATAPPSAGANAAAHDHSDGPASASASDQGRSDRRRGNNNCTTPTPTSQPSQPSSPAQPSAPSQPSSPAPGPSSAPVIQPADPGQSCENSNLPVHEGFQNGNLCVAVERGEVPTAENAPSLLIVSAPQQVAVNTPFEIVISTRNIVRNFFKPAASGGYYDSRSFLNAEGILHGHVHTAIRPLLTAETAPDAAPVPIFFRATEDGLGGREPDTFVVQVPGIATPGLYQIASWCGDASHGVPMAQRANQTPAFDAVRITVVA